METVAKRRWRQISISKTTTDYVNEFIPDLDTKRFGKPEKLPVVLLDTVNPDDIFHEELPVDASFLEHYGTFRRFFALPRRYVFVKDPETGLCYETD